METTINYNYSSPVALNGLTATGNTRNNTTPEFQFASRAEESHKTIMDETDVKNFLYMMVGLDVKVESGSDKTGSNVNTVV